MVHKLSSDSCRFKLRKFTLYKHVGDSGVTVIMAASQAVDPGSTPGCRTRLLFCHFFSFFFFLPSKTLVRVLSNILLFSLEFLFSKIFHLFFHSKFQRGRTRTTRTRPRTRPRSRPLCPKCRGKTGYNIIQYGGRS